MPNHCKFTTGQLNPSSSKEEILDAIRACTKLALQEHKESGKIGNGAISTPVDLRHAFEISLGLAVTDARRQVGSKVPPFNWDKSRWPENYRKSHRIPYAFNPLSDSIEKAKKETQETWSWTIGDPMDLFKEIVQESENEINDPELAESLKDVLDDEDAEREKSMSPAERIRMGIENRNAKRGKSNERPVSLSELKKQRKLAGDWPDEEETPLDKIRAGLGNID